jgi:hypothetical protein
MFEIEKDFRTILAKILVVVGVGVKFVGHGFFHSLESTTVVVNVQIENVVVALSFCFHF